MVAAEYVADRIAARYASPGRAAYLYLFWLKPGSDFSPLTPAPDTMIAAWVDEGGGLSPSPPALAAERCAATHHLARTIGRPANAQQRRQRMARSVQFTITAADNETISVRLVSRSLAFSPRGDRTVQEEWHRSGEGWYSAYRPEQPDSP